MSRNKVQRGRDFSVTIGEARQDLYLRRPNQRELFDIDIAYRTAMTRLIESGVMTSHKAGKLYEGTGEWTKLDENDLKNATVMIANRSKQLEDKQSENSKDDNMKLVDEINRWRATQMTLIGRKTDLFSHCAERLAEEQKIHSLILLCCCSKEDDTRFFESSENYQKFTKEHSDVASKILAEAYNFEYGIDPDKFGEDWAEVKYLKGLADCEKEAPAEVAATAEGG